MQVYNVFVHELQENSVFVEDKISFSAFFFQVIWLLYHKLWLPALMVLLLEIIVFQILEKEIISNLLALGLELVILSMVAIHAKCWYIQKLKSKGYKFNTVIVAKSLDEARLRFYAAI